MNSEKISDKTQNLFFNIIVTGGREKKTTVVIFSLFQIPLLCIVVFVRKDELKKMSIHH